jgi:hypothetical protein
LKFALSFSLKDDIEETPQKKQVNFALILAALSESANCGCSGALFFFP